MSITVSGYLQTHVLSWMVGPMFQLFYGVRAVNFLYIPRLARDYGWCGMLVPFSPKNTASLYQTFSIVVILSLHMRYLFAARLA